MTETKTEPKQTGAIGPRSEGLSYEALLAADTKPVPDFILEQSYEPLGSEPVPVEHYTSQAYFDKEVEKMWPRVWQMVCLEDEIPNKGDYIVYENVGRSFVVTRLESGGIQAYYNSCLHRGRKLRTEDGTLEQIRCPYHGFTWNLDGSLKEVPCEWDFAHLEKKEMSLPQAQVDTWAGFVFINEDPDAKPLEEYLEVLPEHFKRWRLDECFKMLHVGKVINANWKVVAEAFMESFHTVETHPQIMPFTGDANARYDTYGDHANRNLTGFAIVSPHIIDKGFSEQEIVESFLKYNGRAGDEGTEVDEVPTGETARAHMAATNRERYTQDTGYDHTDATDAELLDAFVYNVFPNFAPWGGFMPNIVYRWRPNGMDVDSCLMEVMLLGRAPKGAPKPPPVEMRFLSEDEPWTAVDEWGALGGVFEQDMGNLPVMQAGMRASKGQVVQMANYQEVRIRHFHQTLEKYLND